MCCAWVLPFYESTAAVPHGIKMVRLRKKNGEGRVVVYGGLVHEKENRERIRMVVVYGGRERGRSPEGGEIWKEEKELRRLGILGVTLGKG